MKYVGHVAVMKTSEMKTKFFLEYLKIRDYLRPRRRWTLKRNGLRGCGVDSSGAQL
jgi:hypothetical protein